MKNEKLQSKLKNCSDMSEYLNFYFLFFSFKFRSRRGANGYAALTLTLLTVMVSLSTIAALTFLAFKEVAGTRIFVKSIEARYAAEAGIEDGVYRIMAGKQIQDTESLVVGSSTVNLVLTNIGAQRSVRSEGIRDTARQNLEVLAVPSDDFVSFFYGIQIGEGGVEMNNNSAVNGNIYTNGNVIGSGGARVTGDVVVAGGLAAVPGESWTSANSDQFFATASSNRDIAQSFTTGAGGILNRVSVNIAKAGTPGNLTLRILTDNAGSPSQTSIANENIFANQAGASPSWIEVPFLNPPMLSPNTKYWIVLDYGSNSATNYWNWRKDGADGYADNTGKITGNWDVTNADWTAVSGDLSFKVWIGGVNKKIKDLTIGDAAQGNGRANLFENVTVRQTECPNAYCIVDNPAPQPLPIPDSVIQEWKDDAVDPEAGGGVCVPPQCNAAGDFIVDNNQTASLGPQKITGKLILNNGATLNVGGTIWVAGNIELSNNCRANLSPSYGSRSGVILTDSKIVISNNCEFRGSGDPASFMMVLSDKNAPSEEVITVDNNSLGVVYYAGKGRIKFSNNAQAKEATAYGITLDNGATITYDSGLSNMFFSSGPGGGYEIKYWKEVE